MTARTLASILLEAQYNYACLMVDAPPEIADTVILWGQANVPDDVLYVEDDGGCGRELECHVTVLYGMLTNEVPDEVYEIAHTTRPFPVLVGNVSLFRNEKFDVVKCDIESPGLRALNARIRSTVPNENKYPDYKPHMTIAYVKKGAADHLEGANIFADDASREFTAGGMVWKGAGDDKEDRVKETLLFSKTKRPAEELFSESASPFDRLPFPADQDKLKAYIRSRRKSRASRPVL